MHRNLAAHLCVLVTLVAAWGCSGDEVDFAADAPGDTPMNDGEVPPPGDGEVPPADAALPDAAPIMGCDAYDYRGTVYDCSALDRCNETDYQYRLACCECNPLYCNPDPTCIEPDAALPPPPDGGVPPDAAPPPPPVESCMSCHNGARANDYTGNGLSNPHPFPGAENVTCTGCHGGNPQGGGKLGSHVPTPPAIGSKQNQVLDPKAYFNRLTLVGIDKLEPANYTSADRPNENFTNLDYLQFINPGDLRVTGEGRGCGEAGCHFNKHAQWVGRSAIATTTGIFSATRFTVGLENRVPGNADFPNAQQEGYALADSAPRAVTNPAYNANTRVVGEVPQLVEQPEKAQFNGNWRNNANYTSANLPNHIINANQDPNAPNRVRTGSPLEDIIDEQVSITCGNCHLGNAGANNRYADFRSSGCSACHMEYSYDGRSRSGDPNVNRQEPVNPDAIAAPERAHVEAHQIRNVAKILPNGAFVRGISDRACVGCHQGSNRTVLQFWGVRMDQNADVTNVVQYPANPDDFEDAANDTRLYDPAVNNQTFNGREANQHLVYEDYDGDGKDDTPPDVHYEAGMGCIDCHGSRGLHGGTDGDPSSGKIPSRQDQQTTIKCESCHGETADYAPTVECTTYEGRVGQCTTDREGNPLKHVTKDAQGNYWLVSRVNGQRHYVPQTVDVVTNTNKQNPLNARLLYSPKASYAMGRADGNIQTGTGPQQTDPNLVPNNFSHTDNLDCAACHASWTNNCIGCHLKSQYDVDPNNYFFSNITGERILLFEANADFVYQTPVPMYMGINSRGKITQISPAEKVFWRYQDLGGVESAVFAFSDLLGEGNNPANTGRNAFPALSQNQMAPHSIRGAPTAENEGVRYCVACHMNVDMLDNFGADYAAFLDDYQNNNFADLNFDLLQQHIGQNTGNHLNSPFFVHMVAGLGTGLFLFDEFGCPVNPLDPNADRQYCQNGAPADNFDANDVVYDLDRLVEINGIPNSSSAHPRQNLLQGPQRIGATNPQMAGPMDARRLQMMADPNLGRILDSWLDADGAPGGDAANHIQ